MEVSVEREGGAGRFFVGWVVERNPEVEDLIAS